MISLATKLRLKHYEAQTVPMHRFLFGKKIWTIGIWMLLDIPFKGEDDKQ